MLNFLANASSLYKIIKYFIHWMKSFLSAKIDCHTLQILCQCSKVFHNLCERHYFTFLFFVVCCLWSTLFNSASTSPKYMNVMLNASFLAWKTNIIGLKTYINILNPPPLSWKDYAKIQSVANIIDVYDIWLTTEDINVSS